MHDELDKLLDQVQTGALDDLTPKQIAALEAHLDENVTAAGRLADVTPVVDRLVPPAGAAPTAAEWENVWQGIRAAGSEASFQPRTATRMIRFWQPLAAVAACFALVIAWRVGWTSPPEWDVRLSDDVVVHELEVFGDSSSFVAYSGDGSGSAVIWVFEEDENQAGV